MKIKILPILVLFPFLALCQCDQLFLSFSTDSELEEFIEMNPECKSVQNLSIYGPDISNLALFSFFDTLKDLSLANISNIQNLDFLEKVEVSSTISLSNLDNLESLSKFEENQPLSLIIINCPLLTSIELTEEYYINITLQSPNVEATVTHNIRIENLNLSQNATFNSLAEVDLNQLWLQNAMEYKSFSAIVADFNIDTLSTLHIFGAQDTFSSEGFPDSMACRSFSILGFKNLDTSGFEGKAAFFRNFNLSDISNLKNLLSFDKMITNSSIVIRDCDSLSSLDGIPISGYIENISISNNPLLNNINDIKKADDFYWITLRDNPNLSMCDIDPICEKINLPNSTNRLKISGNKTTCYDLPSVELSCQERNPVECSISFLGTTKYNYDHVNLSFELMVPQSFENNCSEIPKNITVHLDGSERKEIYNSIIHSSNIDPQKLDIQILNSDLLNDNFDCLDIAIQDECGKDECYFYLCQILNRNDSQYLHELITYPNPSSSILIIESQEDFASNIYDLNGQIHKSINIKKGLNHIDISELPQGMFMIKDGTPYKYKKFLIQR